MREKCLRFLKNETVLCAAAVLAVASLFLVPPDASYAGYIDWDTLAMLFCLMAVVRGLQKAGVFLWLGGALLRRTRSTRQMAVVLVFLPFFFSMAVTNDVSLITFVPFALIVLRLAGQQRLAVPIVVLQTLAANLGSMLTPMGNPQNLYLFTQSGLSFGGLCAVMAPYAALSFVCLLAAACAMKAQPIEPVAVTAKLGERRSILWCLFGFVLCLLAIFDVLPPLALAPVFALFLLIFDRDTLRGVDYSLLLTFAAFFIFIGNLGRLEGFRALIASALAGREVIVSVLASQVISNVPAALLLSGFTSNWESLLIGCNLGGLGTLIASMASLISYKFISRQYPAERGRYLLRFTAWNVGLLVLLLLLALALGAVSPG